MTHLHPPLPPRRAATLILVRDYADEMQVLMLQRTHRAAFIPGGYVFPGGAVDAEDSSPAFLECVTGLDGEQANRILGLEQDGLAYWIAAVRECFEEAGILLAQDSAGNPLDAAAHSELERARAELAKGNGNFLELCQSLGLRLPLYKLHYFANWTTQLGAPRRFATRFFATVAPCGQIASHDRAETIHHLWISPAEALARHHDGEMRMVLATVHTLELLAAFKRAEEFIAHARTVTSPPLLFPRYARRGGAECVLLDDHPAYAEIGKLDRAGTGDFSCELIPGKATTISRTLRRVTAPNPGVMTGPGTNTYLLGTGNNVAVIDPGPADDAHIENLLALTQGRIRWILVTHTHLDHSMAATRLRQRTGAQLLGMAANHPDRQDLGFVPEVTLADGQILELGESRLEVVHTPGHASNHFCYYLREEGLLFTGDHIMQGSTVVINPPDGNMAAYIQSLLKIRKLNAEYIAPGHGFLMDTPARVIDGLVKHRFRREQKIIESLAGHGACTIADLLPRAYDDVPEHKHRAASRSLLAHLIKLKAEGRVTEENARWSLDSA